MADVTPLRALRNAAGLTQEQVAGFLGAQQAGVSQWEAGSTRPNDHAVTGMAQLYGVDVPTLIDAIEATMRSFAEGIDARMARAIGHTKATLGLTQVTLAEAVGVSQAAVAFWEAGKYRPSLAVLAKVAALTGRTPDRFLIDAGYEPHEVEGYLDDGAPPNPLAQLLRAGREAKGLTQTKVGHACGIDQVSVSAIETGTYLPDDATLETMTRLYGLVEVQVRAAQHAAEVAVGRIPTPTVPRPLVASNLTRQQYVREVRAHEALRKKDLAGRLGVEVGVVSALEADDRESVHADAAAPGVLRSLAAMGGASPEALAEAWCGVRGHVALSEGRAMVHAADSISELLKVLAFRGMTQDQIAGAAGTSRQAANNWVHGAVVPSGANCRSLAVLVPGVTEADMDELRHRSKHGRPQAQLLDDVEPTPAENIFAQVAWDDDEQDDE